MSDGLRWQEIFTGADPSLMDSEHGGIWANPKDLKQKFWRDDVSQRRKALFPFLWTTIAHQGQIFGNQTKGSVARVTNGMAFSYPGYNEKLWTPMPRIPFPQLLDTWEGLRAANLLVLRDAWPNAAKQSLKI